MTYPKTKLFYPITKNHRKIYSQHNQDHIVYENFFKGREPGFFCDIGGNHPLNINNTLYFEELGWTGIAFEPIKHLGELWDTHRKAKLYRFALSDCQKLIDFTVVKDITGWEEMLSFVNETRDKGSQYVGETIKVQAIEFKKIMENLSIDHIDYLSLDVEGHEINVLKGIDFSAVRINVLTIENNPSYCKKIGDDTIRKIMIENNYIFWGRIMWLDDIYVHKDYMR